MDLTVPFVVHTRYHISVRSPLSATIYSLLANVSVVSFVTKNDGGQAPRCSIVAQRNTLDLRYCLYFLLTVSVRTALTVIIVAFLFLHFSSQHRVLLSRL